MPPWPARAGAAAPAPLPPATRVKGSTEMPADVAQAIAAAVRARFDAVESDLDYRVTALEAKQDEVKATVDATSGQVLDLSHQVKEVRQGLKKAGKCTHAIENDIGGVKVLLGLIAKKMDLEVPDELTREAKTPRTDGEEKMEDDEHI